MNTLTKIIGGTLLAGTLFLTGYNISEGIANHFKSKIELKEEQNPELEKELALEKEQKTELEKKLESEKSRRIEFEEKWKALLFNYGNLGKVDFSRKKVTLDVYIDESEELEIYKKNKEKIFRYISDFYKKMGVDLDIRFVDDIDQSALKPAKHLAIEIYGNEKWVQRDCELAGIESKLGCNIRNSNSMETGGRANMDKNTALVRYNSTELFADLVDKFEDYVEELEARNNVKEKALEAYERELRESYGKEIRERREAKWKEDGELIKLDKKTDKKLGGLVKNKKTIYKKRTKKKFSNTRIRRKAYTIVHELGHLFGLPHSNLFTNDPVPNYLSAKNKVPNYMMQNAIPNYSTRFPIGCGFNKFQKRIVHSYLSGGKVYQQLEAVNFDFHEYLEHIKKANGYKERKRNK